MTVKHWLYVYGKSGISTVNNECSFVSSNNHNQLIELIKLPNEKLLFRVAINR